MSNPMPLGAVVACTHSGYADGETVADMRERVRAWLNDTVALDTEQMCDILLATDEALANCAEHAYRDRADIGAMTLDLTYDPATAEIKICVTDQGGWLEPDPAAINATRGRGLKLMHALANLCVVDGRAAGTTVCLHFHDCPTRRRQAAAQVG